MALTDKMWEGITRVIRMDTKVEGLASTVKEQQARIEDLTGRTIRLETMVEIAQKQLQKKYPRRHPYHWHRVFS